jgi:uncharacterized protein YecE (DUF72 family)
MAIKASRYLTHVRRLRDPAEPVTRMLSAATALGARLGPVLLQLPPTMRADPPLLAACLDQIAAFRGGGAAGGAEAAGGAGNGQGGPVRVAVEPRHESWWTDQARAVLAERNAALCWADRLGEPVTPLWRTADWGYLRFHEGTAWPWPRYPDKPLRAWAERLAAAWPGGDAYVYFNNDPGGAAIADAATFAAAAQAHGLPVSRVPAGVTPVPGVPGWEPWERPTRSPGSRG